MILLTKLSEPVPSLVLLLTIVGFTEVLQHTPFAVTDAPPSLVIAPPLTAEFDVTEVTAAVVTAGATINSGLVEKLISLPYAVPPALVA